jgi:hypothetical protein
MDADIRRFKVKIPVKVNVPAAYPGFDSGCKPGEKAQFRILI